MKWWKIIAQMAIPIIRQAGIAKEQEDANDTGKDDLEGVSLVYAADLLNALVNGTSPPKAPAALR
jgi:hypothetical protein